MWVVNDALWHYEMLWKSCFHKQTLVVVHFGARERSDSWNSGWPTAPTVMRTWQAPKPQHSTPGRRPDQELFRKFSLSGLQLFSKGSCGPFLFQLGQLTPKENTEFPSIKSQLKCLLSVKIITPHLQQTLCNPSKLCSNNCKFCSHQTCHLSCSNRDY